MCVYQRIRVNSEIEGANHTIAPLKIKNITDTQANISKKKHTHTHKQTDTTVHIRYSVLRDSGHTIAFCTVERS